jgi:hypothetical protein
MWFENFFTGVSRLHFLVNGVGKPVYAFDNLPFFVNAANNFSVILYFYIR